MRFLFVHQNFPGQFLHLVRALVAEAVHDIVFLTEQNENVIHGVRKIAYEVPRTVAEGTWRDAREFEAATLRAEAVARTARTLKALGFAPDIIIGHHGWGELLNIEDVWPGVPLLGYHEFYYRIDSLDVNFDAEFPTAPDLYPRIRAKNAVNLLALTNPGHGQTPTRFQHASYPGWARPNITVLGEGVDLDLCRPDPLAVGLPFVLGGFQVAPGEKLVTYVARDLEPYRGFHVMMRALPAILARPDTKVVLVGGDGVSYGARLAEGSWREVMLEALGNTLDLSRVCFPGKVAYADYRRLLQRSDAHVYLTYPFVASWSLREALASGCAVVASDTAPVLEFVSHGETGWLTPCLDPARLAERVLEVLEGGAEVAGVRAAARQWAERNLRMDQHLHDYRALIGRLVG